VGNFRARGGLDDMNNDDTEEKSIESVEVLVDEIESYSGGMKDSS
jgi:hypothetical protein